jgi:hypothetical protein
MFGSTGFALAASSSSSSSFPRAAPERHNDSSIPSAMLRAGPKCGRRGAVDLARFVLNRQRLDVGQDDHLPATNTSSGCHVGAISWRVWSVCAAALSPSCRTPPYREGSAPFDRLTAANTSAAIMPDSSEAARTPSRTCFSTTSSSKASVPMKRLMVKPMPVRMAIA